MTSKTPKHILQLSTEQKRAFLDSFDTVFTDIDGVVWNFFSEIEGASDGYKALENAGKSVTYITNNSVRSTETCEKKFQKANLNVDVNNIWHPAKSIVKYLQNINFDGLIFVLATENFKNVLRSAGFQIIDGPNEIIEESVSSLIGHIFDKHPVRAVVIDVDFNMNVMKLMRAHLYLRNPECLLIAGATDMLLPLHANANILGPGPFVKILNESTENELITLGKPGAGLAELLKREHNIKNPKRSLMIGDSLEQDIQFGFECGFQTLAVLSGLCKLDDVLKEKNTKLIPDYYADSMSDFVEFMNDIKKSQV